MSALEPLTPEVLRAIQRVKQAAEVAHGGPAADGGDVTIERRAVQQTILLYDTLLPADDPTTELPEVALARYALARQELTGPFPGLVVQWTGPARYVNGNWTKTIIDVMFQLGFPMRDPVDRRVRAAAFLVHAGVGFGPRGYSHFFGDGMDWEGTTEDWSYTVQAEIPLGVGEFFAGPAHHGDRVGILLGQGIILGIGQGSGWSDIGPNTDFPPVIVDADFTAMFTIHAHNDLWFGVGWRFLIPLSLNMVRYYSFEPFAGPVLRLGAVQHRP